MDGRTVFLFLFYYYYYYSFRKVLSSLGEILGTTSVLPSSPFEKKIVNALLAILLNFR